MKKNYRVRNSHMHVVDDLHVEQVQAKSLLPGQIVVKYEQVKQTPRGSYLRKVVRDKHLKNRKRVTGALAGKYYSSIKHLSDATKSTPGAVHHHREIEAVARHLRAVKEQLSISEARLIVEAKHQRKTQAETALLLSISQPTVSRVLREVKQAPEILSVKPREIINRFLLGQIDRETMLQMLMRHEYVSALYDPTGGDGYIAGDWKQVEQAFIDGELTDEEYERIASSAPLVNAVSRDG